MKKIVNKKLFIIILTAVIAVIVMLLVIFISINSEKKGNSSWIIKSYNNSVALYYGDELKEIYPQIVLDTLPDEDKKILDNGIAFPTKKEALIAIEDYDG